MTRYERDIEKFQTLGYQMTICSHCRKQYPVVFPKCPLCRVETAQDPEPTRDCNTCEFHKALSNRKYKGVRIPGGYGKCCRPGGHCSPHKVNEGIRPAA